MELHDSVEIQSQPKARSLSTVQSAVLTFGVVASIDKSGPSFSHMQQTESNLSGTNVQGHGLFSLNGRAEWG
jgi:hypothetical protein